MKPPLFADGSSIGDWTVLGFIGRGGSGEVYRVKCGDEIAAAKVLYKDDLAARERFRLEIEVLSKFGRDGVPSPSATPDSSASGRARRPATAVGRAVSMKPPQGNGGVIDARPTAFPRFIAAGSISNRPYLITEFLQPAELPRTDGALADYLLQICHGLSELHAAGLVHRDLKPMNIMRRENGELVIIDIGLVKDTWRGTRPQDGVSIVSGKAVAVGSPGYGAPEQFQGGAISPLTDIHALGRIANAAFDNRPPRNWEEIIRRSTSSIPEQRYGSVEEFAAAIRHRNDSRRLKTAALLAAAVFVIGVFVFGRAVSMKPPQGNGGVIDARPTAFPRFIASDLSRFRALCHPATISRVENELLWERLETNVMGRTKIVSPVRAYRTVTNEVSIIAVDLAGATNVFTHPLTLPAGREYVFTGPGVFDADLSGDGNAVTVRIEKCVFLNRTAKPLAASGVRYILDGGAYLNFTRLDRTDDYQNYILPFDDAFNVQLFKGPESLQDAENGRVTRPRVTENQSSENFSKFPREILTVSSEYMVESMKKHDTIRLDPNRIPTDAEVDLVAFVFDVSVAEARSILASRANSDFKVNGNRETHAIMSPCIFACETPNG